MCALKTLPVPNTKKIRPFIKWAGSKYKLLDFILSKLPPGKVLIEPFVGSGAVFLNTNYDYYLLNDSNSDLINLYTILQQYGEEFIKFCQNFFNLKNNTAIQYYKFREEFNYKSNDLVTRAALFLYLNKHAYNGLCRVNKDNKFNVPFGRHDAVNFPENNMRKFYLKANRAKFSVKDFTDTLQQKMLKGSVIYCDPPYLPLSKTSNFVAYQSTGFNMSNQQMLSDLALKLSIQGIPVLISNNFTSVSKKIYNKADELATFKTRRMISCKPESRNYVTEVLAIYKN